MDGKYVFISYKVEDSDYAVWVKETLESNGIPCWMAPDSIPGGSSYINEIEKAISNCSALVLVLTENVKKSEWIPREINRAADYKKRIMPFDLDNCNLDGQGINLCLAPIQRYDAVKDKLAAMRSMIDDIREEFNAPKANIVFNKKPPKSKNNGEKKKMKLWKKILLALFLIPVIIAVAEFLIAFVFTPSDTEDNSTNGSTSGYYQSEHSDYEYNYADDDEKEIITTTASKLDSLTFELDGVTYSLPCNVSELYENGWICETRDKDEVQYDFYVEMIKGNSRIWIDTYSAFEGERSKFIDQKVGCIEYTPDCNVSFSVNGTIQPGSHYNDVIAEFGEPEQISNLGNNTEYKYFTTDDNYETDVSFVFYTDTSRCHSINLENVVYTKDY